VDSSHIWALYNLPPVQRFWQEWRRRQGYLSFFSASSLPTAGRLPAEEVCRHGPLPLAANLLEKIASLWIHI